ncbi:MAG TPA: xanthine dehydrogenase family protein molybdopterin-binding subunit [Arthrobacter sp.]|nr:xanthine dehydrogenase family protein molybdopterin-binding subunit [Arthrobacter sp.]
MNLRQPAATGLDLERVDGRAKVLGLAPYAYEHPAENPTYLHAVQSTIARGRIAAIDTAAAETMDGVVAVLTHLNAPRLANAEDKELAVLQSDEVGFRGQFVAAVVADSPESAREAAAHVRVQYHREAHHAALRADHDDLYKPDVINAGLETDTQTGDPDAALASAAVVVDRTYTTPAEHNNPMEPHTTVAQWNGDRLLVFDSTQSVHNARKTLAPLFDVEVEQIRVVAPHVGGGFGSKGLPHAHVVLTALAAKVTGGRPVKYALSRQQMFFLAGYRTPTIQRLQLGASGDGRISVLTHDVVEQTSAIKEFAEQTAGISRMMYAADHRRTTHRLASLDVPVPSWMRAPGECPGSFGLEVAMDELAEACGIDPIELRVRNEPAIDPETGKPFASRHLLACLREGARRFGWERRNAQPGTTVVDGWRTGIGVAASTYPARRQPANTARIRFAADGFYDVQIGAVDLGTGAWTALTQIAAEALECGPEQVRLQIGDTDLPAATVAGGSSGTSSWGSAIIGAAQMFRKEHGAFPSAEDTSEGNGEKNPASTNYALHSFGAQFAEVQVHADTGEIRVSRMLGVYSAGRIINPRTARSQFLGGMTMGIGMALHEHSVMDERFGMYVNHDLAEYHVPANADVRQLEAFWLEEVDEHAGPLGARGIGEIGIVGAAAAVANAAYNATGIRVRDLPLTADKFLA